MYIYTLENEIFYSKDEPTKVDLQCVKDGAMSIVDTNNMCFIGIDEEGNFCVDKIPEAILITEPDSGLSYHSPIKYQGPL